MACLYLCKNRNPMATRMLFVHSIVLLQNLFANGCCQKDVEERQKPAKARRMTRTLRTASFQRYILTVTIKLASSCILLYLD